MGLTELCSPELTHCQKHCISYYSFINLIRLETRQNHSPDIQNHYCKLKKVGYVVDQFYPWLNFYFPLFWSIVMYDNKFKTKGNKI